MFLIAAKYGNLESKCSLYEKITISVSICPCTNCL